MKNIEPGIYVEATGASEKFFGDQGVLGKKHLYLVRVSSDGQRSVIRGGFNWENLHKLDLQVNAAQADSKDKNTDADIRPSQRLDIDPKHVDDAWRQMISDAEEIQNSGFTYDSLVPGDNRPETNSNSVIRRLIEKQGLDVTASLPEGLNEKDVPGYENNLEAQLTYDKRRRAAIANTKDGAERRKALRDVKEIDLTIPVVPHGTAKDKSDDPIHSPTSDEVKPDDQSALPPEAEKLRAVFRLSDEDEAGAVGLMRKDIADLTQDEVDAMHGFAFDERDRDTRHALQDRLRDFYQLTYGEGKVETDEIGRMVQPTAVRAVPETTLAAKTATGEWLKPALKRVADTLARRAKEDGAAKTVTDVQSGLSALGAALKPDGIAGPHTRTAVIDAVAKAGPGKIDEAWILGAFKSFADQAKAKPATVGSLAQTLKKNVDPLFKLPSSQKPKAPVPVQVDVMPERIKPAPSIEASATTRALQRGLNDLKPDTPVKEDGVLGPKTTRAFNRALRDEGSDGVTQSFASTLGFS